VKKSLSRAVAITATCAAGLTGALTHIPSATAEAPAAAAASNLTDFGLWADVYGTKVLINGVELRTVKDAYAKQTCTRVVGRQVVKPSIASIPLDNDLIDLSASSSRTQTYRTGSLTGVRGVNTIAKIALGGELPGGIKTPTLNIDGLVSTADSFYNAKTKKFGHDESFSFKGISIGNIDDSVVGEVPGLAELLYIVNDLVAPVNVIVDELVQLLLSITGNTIEIPGLGAISLGATKGTATAHHAASSASALRILVNPTGEDGNDTLLELGRARTRIADGATSGVFGSQMVGMEFLSGNDALRMGGVGQISMPCEGTDGKVVRKRIGHVSLGLEPIASVLSLSGVEYRTMGKQLAKGKMRGFVESNLGKLSLPIAGLTIEGLKSRIDVTRRPGKKTIRKITGSIAKVTIGDKVYTAKDLKMGKEIAFDGGVISIGKRVKTNWNGANVRLVDVNLVDFGSIVTVGIADLYARPK
jgi:hypothetical protein